MRHGSVEGGVVFRERPCAVARVVDKVREVLDRETPVSGETSEAASV